MTDRIFRYSEIKAFKTCRRKWYNGYHLGWKLPEFTGERKPSKADNGTLVHSDLEQFYNGVTERPGDWLRTQTPPESEQFQKEWNETYNLSQIMLDGYADWLEDQGSDQGERTLGTEMELDMELGEFHGDKVTVRIHIDRLVFDETWDRYIIDDVKTVDSLDKNGSFTSDDQLLTYAVVVESVLGYKVSECRHSMLRRVKRTARANPPFYGRESIEPNEDQLASHLIQLRSVVAEMVLVSQRLEAGEDHRSAAYSNVSRDCSWSCDFLPICSNHDDGSDLDGLRQSLYINTKEDRNATAS